MIKIIQVVLLASVKYFFTLPYALLIGLDYDHAIIALLVGGIGGFLFFYYLSKEIIMFYRYIKPRIINIFYRIFKKEHSINSLSNKESHKIFTGESRRLIKLRNTFGYWGLIIGTPFLLSIPVGAFLANRYYSRRPHTVPYMIVSILGWAAVLTIIVNIFPNVFF